MFDLAMFADKFRRYCAQFGVSPQEVHLSTGIPLERLTAFAQQESQPTGDEVLILADFFKCDFRFFISNERLAPFEQTESLFRTHAKALTREDRWAIQEFLFLCECQEFLLSSSPSTGRRSFEYVKTGRSYKHHGRDAAFALRRHIGYRPNEASKDIYRDFRGIGIHIFRRKLRQSGVSGLFVRHPVAGPCVLINYSEDVFRQRFTAAHEAAHAILDDGTDFVVSFSGRGGYDRSEVRANAFASHFLMPPEFLTAIPAPHGWNQTKLVESAAKLMVSAEALAYALKDVGLISSQEVESLKGVRVPRDLKSDPELPDDLSPNVRSRKEEILQRGLSDSYVGLCFDAYGNGVITQGRLAEMLLVNDRELLEIARLYRRRLEHVD